MRKLRQTAGRFLLLKKNFQIIFSCEKKLLSDGS